MDKSQPDSENPFAPPANVANANEPLIVAAAVGQQGAWRDGRRLVMQKHTELPPICVKSGELAGVWLLRNFSWCPPVLYLVLLAGLLPAVIVLIIMSKKGAVYLPITREVKSKRLKKQFIAGGMALLCVVSLVAGIILASEGHTETGIGLMLASLVLIIASLVLGSRSAQLIQPVRITDEYMWFKGVHENLLNTLEAWEPGAEVPPRPIVGTPGGNVPPRRV